MRISDPAETNEAFYTLQKAVEQRNFLVALIEGKYQAYCLLRAEAQTTEEFLILLGANLVLERLLEEIGKGHLCDPEFVEPSLLKKARLPYFFGNEYDYALGEDNSDG
jgi:hypothetical protein